MPKREGVYSRLNFAFTLAEVLITLGIIGVVAALTIPPLVQKHKKMVVETRLKHFYSTINQAIVLSETENLSKEDWWLVLPDGCSNTGSEACLTNLFNKYFKNYLAYSKVEYKAKTTNVNFGALYIYFNNGSVIVNSYKAKDWIFFVDAKMLDKPAVAGKDYFQFGFYPDEDAASRLGARKNNWYKKGVEPYITWNWDGTTEGLLKTKDYAKYLQMHEWKIPDNYPIKF